MTARSRCPVGRYLLLAARLTASLQLVGVPRVFVSLIVPALATPAFGGARRILAANLMGATGDAGGLGLSPEADLHAGATVVCCMCLLLLAGLGYFRPASSELY
ncbi:MAG: metal ABC transporter permease [Sulfuritalea sp.]|nr:metal ABC transporter permease [Sulfuritalea sp.]